MNTEYQPIGKITLKSLKHYINTNDLGETDTIVLNEENFDDLIMEFRQFYGKAIPIPFIYITVMVKTSPLIRVALDQAHVIHNDPERETSNIENNHNSEPEETRSDARRRMWWGK